MHIAALEAFRDNYIWLLRPHAQAVPAWVVDPGDAAVVIDALRSQRLQLRGILVTHHHADHVGGVAELVAYARDEQGVDLPVWGPADEDIPARSIALSGGQQFDLPELGCHCQVLAVPGHTAGHIAYVLTAPGEAPALFCGDTLFSAGCGRLFEGTPAQMHQSLNKLVELPEKTRVFCAHEYTVSNLEFARVAEPDNEWVAQHLDRCKALRAAGLPTLPSSIGLEKRINPFLRTRETGIRDTLQRRHGQAPQDAVQALAWLREWKNAF